MNELTQYGSLQAEKIETFLTILEGQEEALLTSLRAGGIGASSLALVLFQTAKTLESEVSWGTSPDDSGVGALKNENLLTISLPNHSLTLSEEPRTLSLSKRAAEPEGLVLQWTTGSSLRVQRVRGGSEESWNVMAGGVCLGDSELEQGLEDKMSALEESKIPEYKRSQPSPRPSGEGPSDWLREFGLDDLAGVAATVAGAAATAAVKRKLEKAVQPATPAPEQSEPTAATTKTPVQASTPAPETSDPTGATTKCPECGEEGPEGAAFCPHCGHKFEPPKPDCCAECGAELVKDAKFCAQCGAKVQREIVCDCGRTFQENEKFCPSCGAKRP